VYNDNNSDAAHARQHSKQLGSKVYTQRGGEQERDGKKGEENPPLKQAAHAAGELTTAATTTTA